MSDRPPGVPPAELPPTARLPAGIGDEVATIQSDPLRWLYGGRILTEDAILTTRGAGKGLALYDELMRDPQVATVISKRVDALVGREWEVKSGLPDDPESEAAAQLVRDVLGAMRLSQAAGKLSGALLKGVAIGEVMWTLRDGRIVPRRIKGRDPRRFAFRAPEAGGEPELRLLTRESVIDGVAVPPRKFVVHRFGDEYENPWGLGLGHRLFWPVFFKRQGISFWLQGLDKYSQPTALGKYPPGANDDVKNTLLAALTAISREAGVIVPDGMAVELLEAKRAGTFDAYESLARYMDEDIAKAVLGETLSTQVGASGSRALGEVHNEVRLEIVKADADRLSETLNDGLVQWIVDLNLPGYAGSGLPYPAVWWDVSEPEDLAARAKRDVDVKSLGYRPTQDYVTATYGEGWEAEAPTQPPPIAVPGSSAPRAALPAGGLPPALAAAFAEMGRDAAQAPRMRDAADDLTLQAGPATAAPIGAWLAEARALIARAGTMQDIAAGLIGLYPGMRTAELAETLGQAMAVADLTGRLELDAAPEGEPTGMENG
jgi:phage gp29-like protein